MVKEVLPNIYHLKIPLPTNAVKVVNSYLIKGEGRNLIIDTGYNHSRCLEAMQAFLSELEVDLNETDIFVTHYHADHAGLVQDLVTDTSTIYCSEADSQKLFSTLFNFRNNWDDFRSYLLRHGFPEAQIETAAEHNPGFKYSSRVISNHTILKDGNSISVGSYRFRCIETPGHTKGHMCLYETDRKLLVAGDHILGNMIPNISLKSDNENPLQEYFQSFEKVETLDVDLLLPGHGSFVTNWRERILELKQHYLRRTGEVLDALKKSDKTTYQVAAELKWHWGFESWKLFTPTHKLFAVWETHALLKYLEEKRLIKREIRQQKAVFSVSS